MNTKETKQEEVMDIENVEIQPLADEDLDMVVGGLCSWSGCSNTKANAVEAES